MVNNVCWFMVIYIYIIYSHIIHVQLQGVHTKIQIHIILLFNRLEQKYNTYINSVKDSYQAKAPGKSHVAIMLFLRNWAEMALQPRAGHVRSASAGYILLISNNSYHAHLYKWLHNHLQFSPCNLGLRHVYQAISWTNANWSQIAA